MPEEQGGTALHLYDGDNSGYAHAPTDILGFLDQRYRGVMYQTIFEADGVYVFRRTAYAGGPH